MSFKISTITPVYNAENDLNIVINSIINQSIGFENIKSILVGDESTDKSREIITSYANKYDNIVLVF